jgi:hypothetical protein
MKINQTNTNLLQVGISAKVTMEIPICGTPNFRLGVSSGIGYLALNSLFPAVNAEYILCYGGLSTYQDNIKHISNQFVVSGSLTAGLNNEFRNSSLEYIRNRNKPLYYFTDLIQPSLQNPFNSSITLGTNFVKFDSQHIEKQYSSQRVGFIGIKVVNFQFGYFNDGGFLMKTGKILGDAEDRYYTGGGFININLPLNNPVNNINASFYRFTGYSPEAFDIANEFLFGYVDYSDPEQKYFNHGFWNFGIGSAGKWNGSVRLNNVYNLFEVQNLIHSIIRASYHENERPTYISLVGSYRILFNNISNNK